MNFGRENRPSPACTGPRPRARDSILGVCVLTSSVAVEEGAGCPVVWEEVGLLFEVVPEPLDGCWFGLDAWLPMGMDPGEGMVEEGVGVIPGPGEEGHRVEFF